MRPAKATTPQRRSTDPRPSYIQRLVKANGGAVALSAKLAAKTGHNFFRQQIEQWVYRGWASPYHYPLLLKVAPKGMTEAHLRADITANKQAPTPRAGRAKTTTRKGIKQ